MNLLKIFSIIGIAASLFLAYVGYGIQELIAEPYNFGSNCQCRIGHGDTQTLAIIIYALSVLFLIFSIIGITRRAKK